MTPKAKLYCIILTVISFKLITSQTRTCPPLVPANISMSKVVGRYYGQEYWLLEPAPDTECPQFNILPVEKNFCGVPIPRHLFYIYFADGQYQLYETIIREPRLGVYSQQRARDLTYPLTTSTILYFKNENLLVHACREEDKFTRFALFTKCKYITQAEKDKIYREATVKIPSNYKLYPATFKNCNITTL